MGSVEEIADLRKKRLERVGKASPAVEKMKAIGHWSEECDSVLFLDPVGTDQYMAMCTSLYAENVLPPKELELLLAACAPASVHIYVPRPLLHIQPASQPPHTAEIIIN